MDDRQVLQVAKIYEDNALRNDALNRRLTIIAIVALICFAVTVTSMTAFYFFSDYQYPSAEQQQVDGNMSQKIGGDN